MDRALTSSAALARPSRLRRGAVVPATTLLLALAACAGPRPNAGTATSDATGTPGAGPGGAAHAGAEASSALPFIEDDYPAALAAARAAGKPLFVDAWAPWCHTCLFMRAHVFPDARLTPHAGRFVWLSIDTEKDANLAFVERFPLDAWPTLFVIEPASEKVAFQWLGSANVEQLGRLFDDAERAVASVAAPGPDAGADALLAEADRRNARKAWPEAVAGYRAALAAASDGWSRRTRAVESLLVALGEAGDVAGCAALARAEAARVTSTPSHANVAALGLACALELDPRAPGAAETLEALELLGRAALVRQDLLADDVSAVYELLVERARRDAKAERVTTLAHDWLEFVERARRAAPDARARAAFDPHLVSAAVESGQYARAVEALEETERALPDDYNAAARLAYVYTKWGRTDAALAAIERGLAKVYGPRRARLLETRAEARKAAGDLAGARAGYEEAIAFVESQPAARRSERTLARLRAALAALAAPAASATSTTPAPSAGPTTPATTAAPAGR